MHQITLCFVRNVHLVPIAPLLCSITGSSYVIAVYGYVCSFYGNGIVVTSIAYRLPRLNKQNQEIYCHLLFYLNCAGVSSTSTATTTPGVPTTSAPLPLTSFELPQTDKNFVGRNDLVRVVCDKILQPPAKKSKSIEVQSLVGPPGFGKTSIAVAVGRTCQEAGLKIEFINLRGVSDISTVDTLVRTRLKEADSSESDDSQDEKGKVKSTSPKSKSKKPSTLVILDNAEDCMTSNKDSNVQLQDVIKSVLSNQSENGIHVLLTSRVQFEVHATEFRMEQHNVGCLDPSHAAELLENLCVDNCMTTEQASTIVRYCGYVPLAIRIATGLLLRNSARNLVQLFEEMGLSVFKDDNLKPQHRILRLLKLALDQLPAEEKEMFYALSQFPTSFSSAAACAVVNYAGESTAVVHLLHFDRLVKICFLEYNRESDRYSMQPFISEFGRHECPENDCDTYRQRLSMFYLTWLTALDQKCPVGVEESAYLSLNFIVDIANVNAALEWSVLLCTDDLVQYIPLAAGAMCWCLSLDGTHVFLERMQLCQSSMTQEQYCLCLLNACILLPWVNDLPVASAKCQEWLERASDSVDMQDGSQLHLQLDISVWKLYLLLLCDLENGSKELCAGSLAALESLSCICIQILNEQEEVLPENLILYAELLKMISSLLLGNINLDMSTLERVTANVVQLRYLSFSGETLSRQFLSKLLWTMYSILGLYFGGMEEDPGFLLTTSLLQSLSPALCSSKQVYSPIPRYHHNTIASLKDCFHSYLMFGVGGVTLSSSTPLCSLSVGGANLEQLAGRTCGFRFIQNLLSTKSIPHTVVSRYVTNYMLRVNGSHSHDDGSKESVPESLVKLVTMEKSCVMDCVLLTDVLLHQYVSSILK